MAQQGQRKGGNRGGGQRQQGGGGNQAPAMTQEQAQQRMKEIFNAIDRMKRAIDAVLPVYISFDKFRAIVLTAIRREPKLLRCTTDSIVTACLKAAYDGLMPDGREAVILPRWNSKIGGLEASYQSMVAGLRKQILAGGEVSDVITTIVYKNEITETVKHDDGQTRARFHEQRGTDPKLWHVPITDDERRGDPVLAYSVAFFRDNRRPTFEVMHKSQIYLIKESSQSGDVWNGPHELEMWRKTVLRRHRKSLPGGNDIIDMEAREMFPDFGGNQDLALAAPPRPTRDNRPALEDRQGTGSGVEMDLGQFEGIREEVELRRDDNAESQGKTQENSHSEGPERTENRENGQDGNRGGEKPKNARNQRENVGTGDAEPKNADSPKEITDWGKWADDIERQIDEKETTTQINALRRSISDDLARAPKEIDDRLTGSFMDAIAGATS